METLYFFIGAVTVTVVLAVVWLLRVVSSQINQIRMIEAVVNNMVSNDITENDVRAIVDSRVDKYADSVSREFERMERDIINYVEGLNTNNIDNMNEIHRRIDDVKRDLIAQININQVTNTRRVTDGGLQSEY